MADFFLCRCPQPKERRPRREDGRRSRAVVARNSIESHWCSHRSSTAISDARLMPQCKCGELPLSPYRCIHRKNSIIDISTSDINIVSGHDRDTHLTHSKRNRHQHSWTIKARLRTFTIQSVLQRTATDRSGWRPAR